MKHHHKWTLARLLLRRRTPQIPAFPATDGDIPAPGTARRAAPGDLQRLVDLDAAWHRDGRLVQPPAASFSDVLKSTPPTMAEGDRLDYWLAGRFPRSPSPGARLESALQWCQAIAVLLGLVLGFGFMAGLIAYDGSQQVNVLWIIALAVLQLVLSLLALAFSFGKARRLPLLSDLVGHLPARLYRGPLRRLLDAPHQGDSLLAPLHTPFLLLLTQRFALAFNTTALLALFIYVALQDIAFGWSTTLDITPAGLVALVRTLALPWAWWPTAVPTYELIEASHFFRLGGEVDAGNPALLGRWWPFLACLWTVYALLPRYLMLRWCRYRWRSTLRQTLLNHPLYRQTLSQFVFDQHGAAREAAQVMTLTLLDMLTHQEKTELDGRKPDAAIARELQARWQAHQQQQEADALSALATLYLQSDADLSRYTSQQQVPDPERLFVIDDWERWGLSRKRLALLAGAGGGTLGAGVGASLDAATAGMSLGSLTATLAAVGAAGSAASVYFSDRLAKVSADHAVVRFGPVQNRQYPWVVLGRLISAWITLSRKVPGSTPRTDTPPDWRGLLGRRQETELEKLFVQCRKGQPERVRPELETALLRIMDTLLAGPQ
ncbi:hypothetical protein S7S_16690 [Isoalcanivorax pacificus W11-5]|uniref:DUF2868 domain-containing protein n=1 Tax=Isoalcanivorax pacificus W11-5 TaxID=391936 RepID=A0A0B4XSN1_9GAMM|nr:DUF2868 domain-containing protein [Isoalcanivorax pacificus]AJD49750.1 hypothetical protein S7S_16690 [Isoalcanivorax pacificus W11-5]